MTSPDANYNTDFDYAVSLDDSITLMASKIIRDVLVTRGEPIRRAQLWQAVELAMGDRKPDVDGVLKRDWFNNQGTGPGRWELTDVAEARESPFTDASGAVNLAVVWSTCGAVAARLPTSATWGSSSKSASRTSSWTRHGSCRAAGRLASSRPGRRRG